MAHYPRVYTGGQGLTGSYLPLAGGTMSADADIFFANGSKLSEGIVDAGGNKGIALTCAVGYEWKWEAGEAYLTNLSGNIVELKQYARAIPLENDDITKGFVSGSYWVTLGGQIYQCQDPIEGAAVWISVDEFGNLQSVTDNGSTTTNSITADGGFFTTWDLGSFQASPFGFDYNKSQIVDDEDRSINLTGGVENGFQMNYQNFTTTLQSYITQKNDVTLGVGQTVDDVFISNYLTVTTTDTLFNKEIKVPKVSLYDGENNTYSSLMLNDNSLTYKNEDDVTQISFEPGNLAFINSDNHYAVFSSNGLLSDTRSYLLPDNDGTIALLSDIGVYATPSLQAVTNVGGQTTNTIQINTGIFATGSKLLTLTSGYVRLDALSQGAMQIEWNRIMFPSSNGIASPVILGATGNAATNFWLPGYKSNFSTPQILTTQEDVWVPFTGSSNNINIFKNQAGNTFSTATFYTRGLTSSNGSITISSTGSNTSTNWAWDIRTNPNLIVDYLQFNTAATASGAVGRFVWNDADGTLDLGLKGGNVTLQIGQEQLVRVVNKTATNITLQESAYQAVRVTGAQGQRLKVDLALATNDALSAETIGLVTETIANNQEGFVTISGLVNKINTTGSLQSETWADGDILYLSPTVAGRITNIKPSAPDHMVIIGYVVYSHAVNGKIFVKVNNGYELDELHNVNIVGATAGQVLQYNGSNGLWENQTFVGGLTLNQVQRAAFLKI